VSTWRSFVWQDGLVHELGALAGLGSSSSGATAINRKGTIVGWSGLVSTTSTMLAFATSVRCGDRPAGDFVDLDSSSGWWSRAEAVNDKDRASPSGSSRPAASTAAATSRSPATRRRASIAPSRWCGSGDALPSVGGARRLARERASALRSRHVGLQEVVWVSPGPKGLVASAARTHRGVAEDAEVRGERGNREGGAWGLRAEGGPERWMVTPSSALARSQRRSTYTGSSGRGSWSRLTGQPLGLLIHFNVPALEQSIRRVGLSSTRSP
jgi:hypothetical protein